VFGADAASGAAETLCSEELCSEKQDEEPLGAEEGFRVKKPLDAEPGAEESF
jgi:hypothetical protein